MILQTITILLPVVLFISNNVDIENFAGADFGPHSRLTLSSGFFLVHLYVGGGRLYSSLIGPSEVRATSGAT